MLGLKIIHVSKMVIYQAGSCTVRDTFFVCFDALLKRTYSMSAQGIDYHIDQH